MRFISIVGSKWAVDFKGTVDNVFKDFICEEIISKWRPKFYETLDNFLGTKLNSKWHIECYVWIMHLETIGIRFSWHETNRITFSQSQTMKSNRFCL